MGWIQKYIKEEVRKEVQKRGGRDGAICLPLNKACTTAEQLRDDSTIS